MPNAVPAKGATRHRMAPDSAKIAHGRNERKLPRNLRAAGLTAVLVAVSTAGNLVLGAYETATSHPYGERVTMDGGQVNISVRGEDEQTMVLLSGYGTASPVPDFTPPIGELEDDDTVVVIERFGYGNSDRNVTRPTAEKISTELHETLSLPGVKRFRHPDGPLPRGMDYANRFPGEVSSLNTIDATVPEDFAIAPKTGLGATAPFDDRPGPVDDRTRPGNHRTGGSGGPLLRTGHRADPVNDDPEPHKPGGDR